MTFQLTEDQQRLRDTADRVLVDRAAPAALRALLADPGETGFCPALWRTLAELGWCGVLVDERHGGSAQTLFDAGLLSEALGGHLAVVPFVETAIAALALQRAAAPAQRDALLPRLARGELVVALAVDETSKHNPQHCACRCEHDTLHGRKRFVMHAAEADYFLVAATATAPDALWLLVAADAPGVAVTPHRNLDGSLSAEVLFDAVTVAPGWVLHASAAPEEWLLDAGRALIAAEQVGLATAVLRRTLDYLRERRQFGRPIGSFQALQHRAAALYAEIELARALTRAALRAQDSGDERAALLASAAKAKASATALRATAEAVQLHGGIGMTDECDIGLFLKRAAVLKEYLGDEHFHTERAARLIGY